MADAPAAVGALEPFGPDALTAAIDRILPSPCPGLLIAVSGGPDSIALMHLLAESKLRKTGLRLAVATVDHGLRADSGEDAAFVLAQAATFDLPAHHLTWTGQKPSRAVQEKARDARYDLLRELCLQLGGFHLVTAHTRDDQAETLLFRMARGSGPGGLAAMRPMSRRDGVTHLRPLLDVPKASLVAACAAGGWAYRTDPSNTNPRFARARMRRILPLLEAEGLGAARLAKLAERMARMEAAIETEAARVHAATTRVSPEGAIHVDVAALLMEPAEIGLRVFRLAIEAVAPIQALRLERLERLAGDLAEAVKAGARLRRTLAGTMLSLSTAGLLEIVVEAPRRRGRSVPLHFDAKESTSEAPTACGSLGKGGSEAYIAS